MSYQIIELKSIKKAFNILGDTKTYSQTDLNIKMLEDDTYKGTLELCRDINKPLFKDKSIEFIGIWLLLREALKSFFNPSSINNKYFYNINKISLYISQDFKPAFGLKNKHLQTIYSSLFTKNLNLKFEIEQFELPDGDFVDCYWYNKSNINQKIVVLFHGLAGSYKSPYIQGTMKNLEKEGFTSVIMHFRSCSGRLNKLPRLYHSGDTSDSLAWLKSLSRRFSNSKLYAVGYSLGGNILLKLLGEIKDSKLLCGAISISAPMELSICVNKLNSGFSKFYQAILLKNLNNILKKKYNFHDMKSLIGIDKTEIKQLKNFLIFDEIYTARIYGFKSAKDYYTKSSSKPYLKDISIPTLIIHSLDDPFMTPEVLPTKDEISSFVKLEISSNGGHLGFISGSFWNPSYYLENKVVEFFKTLDL